ncbi:MAG: 50S ribosomal protein L3 [Gammaproteobacteria bacterium]
MPSGFVFEKCGMTRVFTESGESIPVTVLKFDVTKVTQIKTTETDGYNAVQMSTGEKKASRMNKPMQGHYKKANVAPAKKLWEVRIDDAKQLEGYSVGQEISLQDVFSDGQMVDVIANSKGKGFAGVVKRHNFRTQDATHGNSLSHRAPGSIGQNQTPGRVFKGKKMAGHLGDARTTVLNQKIVKVDADKKLVLLAGAVPGAPGRFVMLRPAVKQKTAGGA